MEPVPGFQALLPVHQKYRPGTSCQSQVICQLIRCPQGKQGSAILKTVIFKTLLKLTAQIQLPRDPLFHFQFPPGLKIRYLSLEVSGVNETKKKKA
jgi:hypothetical protein